MKVTGILLNFFALSLILHYSSGVNLPCVPYTKKNVSVSFFRRLFKKPPQYDYAKQTRFYLMTRKNPKCTQELTLNDKNVLNSSFFNSNYPTRILIHGWKNHLYSSFNKFIKNAYLKRGPFNIIIVDWSDISNDINYARAASSTWEIGKIVANFTQFLLNENKITLNNTYLIGHSLGAQISGVTGYFIQKQLNNHEKFNTIYALDPAAPKFQNIDLKYKIDVTDANYVESIQTDLSLFGQQESVGHASFFPAYGKIQPGCSQIISGCSHSRAYKYFAESITSVVGFWASRCENINEIKNSNCACNSWRNCTFSKMGGEPSTPKVGIYYVPIRPVSPYAVGKM